MKYYHVDRAGRLGSCRVIELFDDYELNGDPGLCKALGAHAAELYPEGITEHGNRYIFDSTENSLLESSFELVRMLKYPSKLSRFQAFYAVSGEQLGRMMKKIGANSNTDVYEVSAECIERYDMNLLLGNCFLMQEYYAEQYWSQKTSGNPLFEYLMKPPVQIIRKLSKDEVQTLLVGGNENEA